MPAQSEVVILRTAIAAAIEAARDVVGSVYPLTTFDVLAAHIPRADAADLEDGHVYVCGDIIDDGAIESRGPSKLCSRTIEMRIGIQRSNVIFTETAKLDDMLLLEELIRDTVRKIDPLPASRQGNQYRLTQIKRLADPDGTPFHYYMLREANCFESYFTATYSVPLT